MCAHLWVTTKCSNCKESERPGHCERDRKRDHQKSHSLQFPPFKFEFKRRKYYSNFIKICALTKEVEFGAETEKKGFQVHSIFGLCVCNSVQPNCSKVFEERLKKKLDNEDVKQVERRSQPTKRATSFSLGSANKSWHRARQPASKRIRNINGLWINKWWVISKCSFAQFIHYIIIISHCFKHILCIQCLYRVAFAAQRLRLNALIFSWTILEFPFTGTSNVWIDCDFDIQRNQTHRPVPWSVRSRCLREFVQRVFHSLLMILVPISTQRFQHSN